MTLTADRKERLDRFLSRSLPQHSRSKLTKLIAEGEVLVDGEPATKSGQELRPGQIIELTEPEESPEHDLAPANIPLDVRYEDDSLLVVNKPRGLAAHPAASLKEPSLVNALLARSHRLSEVGGSFRPGIVHRLDKDTTGLMIVAKTDAAHLALAKQIERKEAERRYVAVVAGEIEHEQFTIEAPIARDRHNRLKMTVDPAGKPARTHVRVLAPLPGWGTLVAARLETGRTHQIRVHLLATGYPVLGDTIYAPKQYRDGPLQLHAVFLAFAHPTTGARIEVFAEPPEDFRGRDHVTQSAVTGF
jgi:23S rRNA pseudouridine1911/1915/1917 synthase